MFSYDSNLDVLFDAKSSTVFHTENQSFSAVNLWSAEVRPKVMLAKERHVEASELGKSLSHT